MLCPFESNADVWGLIIGLTVACALAFSLAVALVCVLRRQKIADSPGATDDGESY
jgi:hypothetical protein